MISNRIFGRKKSPKYILSPTQQNNFDWFVKTILFGTFISMLGIIIYYVYALAAIKNGSSSFDWLLGIFSDFVSIMKASLSENPYIYGKASYPPIAIAVLYPFALICKDVFNIYKDLPLNTDELTSRIILHREFWIAMILFWGICSICIVTSLACNYKLGLKNSFKLAALTIFSSPFIYCVMRGNTIYFALIFLLLYLFLYNSKSAFVREISYICLVISGAIKIYPLFFGVFVLNKKRFFAAVRIALYSIILFFSSFLLYGTDFGEVICFFKNLGGFANDNARLLETNNLSITSLIYKLFYLTTPPSAESSLFKLTNFAVIGILFLLSAIVASITKSNFSRSVIASSIAILIPSVSYFYVISIFIIPFFEFIKHYDDINGYRQKLYKLSFAFLFFTPFIMAINFIPHTIIIIIVLLTEILHVIANEFINKTPAI